MNDHTSALGEPSTGRADYRRRLPGFLAAFDGLRYEIEDIVSDGDRVVAAYHMSATYDGYPVSVRGVSRFQVAGDAIARRVDYWDSLTFLRQTGQVPG